MIQLLMSKERDDLLLNLDDGIIMILRSLQFSPSNYNKLMKFFVILLFFVLWF